MNALKTLDTHIHVLKTTSYTTMYSLKTTSDTRTCTQNILNNIKYAWNK